ncbi:hypothetical protein KUCAC02_009433, partial [Chaenocephalus aceratus]
LNEQVLKHSEGSPNTLTSDLHSTQMGIMEANGERLSISVCGVNPLPSDVSRVVAGATGLARPGSVF